MRWQNERRSDNVEDRRGISAGQVAIGGGIGTILIVLVMSLLTGADPRALMQRMQVAKPGGAQQKPAARSPE
ncbi:MAG: neutral zinc metallopeptidase, partial [Isosphaeraceae bacterium]